MYRCLIILCCSLIPLIAKGEGFLQGTQDIPQMDGLVIQQTQDVDFDTPAGQILSIDAFSKQKTGRQIKDYYNATLPQLGWIHQKDGSFKRENDSFSITVLKEKKPSKVRFDIILSSGA